LQKHLNNAKDIFQLTLAKLNLSPNQREFCLNSKVTDNITYDHAKQIAEMANLKNFSLTAWEEATKLIETHNQHQVKVVPLGSEYYPPSLELIDNPPKIIFAKGNFDLLLNNPGVSIVGSRSATKFGLKAAEKIAAHFAERGLVIVSGLALVLCKVNFRALGSSQSR
jgi:DNA processing protein